MHVFVVDHNRQPLTPCHPAVARRLLARGRAAVLRRFPFTIILKESKPPTESGLRLKIDPGSRVTGLALLQGNRVVWAAELKHRGPAIRDALKTRASLRRGRRYRKTRYRHPRFPSHLKNRLSGWNTRPEDWLPPSLMSRVHNVMTWVRRLIRFVPVTGISVENVRFDTQKMMNPEISGVEYQQGELLGYEVREYLLEKWGRKCVYCGARNVRLEIDHIVPKARKGSDRVSNLTISCRRCNERKGNRTAAEFGHPRIQAKARIPLRDAAAVNSARRVLVKCLWSLGLPVETGTGGMTKWNRSRLQLPKTHWLDAACVGMSTPETVCFPLTKVLVITAKGHGVRQRARTDQYGFPVAHKTRQKVWHGLKTGDIAKAEVPSRGKTVHTRRFWGRVIIDSPTRVRLKREGKRPSTKFEFVKRIHSADGYDYGFVNVTTEPTTKAA